MTAPTIDSLTTEPDPRKKLYALVRKDLSPAQQAVQASHAVARFIVEHGRKKAVQEWLHDEVMILLSADSQKDVLTWGILCSKCRIPFTYFREPDMDNQVTAVAFMPRVHEQEMFAELPLAFPHERKRKLWQRLTG